MTPGTLVPIRTLILRALAVALGMLPLSTYASAMDVVTDASHIHFISVKKGSIAEIGGFSRFNGSVDDSGNFTLTIDLSSVDTAVDIRDQRMRDELFETARFPVASLSGVIDIDRVAALAVGEEQPMTLDATLSLHGIEHKLASDVTVVRLQGGSISVASVDPILLSVEALGLTAGVDKLQSLAGLSAISRVVPVYFRLVLR